MPKTITDNSQVTFHFALYLDDGSVAHSTYLMEHPAVCCFGDGQLPPAFERCLHGLQVGDKQTFLLAAEDAFGQLDPEQVHYLHRHEFNSDLKLEEGLVVAFSKPDGSEVPGLIRQIAGDSITVDFNHPLAGQPIHFEVEILAIDNQT